LKTALRLGMVGLLATLLGLLALTVGLWAWSGSSSSLATALAQTARLLPAGQTLTTRDVSGDLHRGGRIGWLRWQSGGLSVEAHDVQMTWDAAAMLHQEIRVTQLAVRQLRIEDARPALTNATPTLPPMQLMLPFKVAASVSIDTLVWVGSTRQQLDKLSFTYIFDSYQHSLDKGYVHISSNKYEFSGELQAQAPMALALKANAQVHTVLAGSTQPLVVLGQASLSGQLAGNQAQLALQATLTPQHDARRTTRLETAAAMQMHLTAQLAPWQPQKIVTAQGQWQALNLAALWPQLPQTLLSGNGLVRPAGSGWRADLQLANALVGPLDQQRLPLQSLSAALGYASGQWQLQTLQASLAGGSIRGSGQYNNSADKSTPPKWQAQADVQGINPAALDSRLAGAVVAGTLSTQQTPAGLGFAVNLQAAAGKPPAPAATAAPLAPPATAPLLRLQKLLAQGLWSDPQWRFDTLHVEVQDASLQGQLNYNSASQAAQGHLSLNLPGLQASLDGQAARTEGQGQLTAQLSDAAQWGRWLVRWPALARLLDSQTLQGQAKLAAQWQGGWQNNAQAMQIKANLTAPQLDWAAPLRNTALHGRQLQLEVVGTPGNFEATSRGTLDTGGPALSWQTALHANRLPGDNWQASISQLQLSMRDAPASKPWQLELGQANSSTSNTPLLLNWLPGNNGRTLTVAAGSAQLKGPLPGSASLSWEPLQWSQPTGSAAAQWRSQGRLANLPLAWLDALGQQTLASLGLSSDLLLSGAWDATHTDSLHLLATLERSSGDLRVTTDASGQRSVPANLSELRLQGNLDGQHLSGSLRWNSERAGKALLALSTQLEQASDGWRLPANAPLGGSLQMQLPPVDAWSMLAPPGWRLRGTMDANIVLSGTVARPQWDGSLQARDLAVRSAVDGIDFSHGSLLARLHGQQLDIEKFSLQGAGSTASTLATDQPNQVVVTGTLAWLTDATHTDQAQRLRINLEAQARALRLSARPDRRIAVSGKLTAQLQDARLLLRGALKADTALLTLPDATPQLGDDVLLRKPVAIAATPATTPSRQSANAAPTRSSSRSLRPELHIELDLGPDFQVRGQGVVTRLAGKLTLTALDLAAPSLSGVVRTADGTYQAYGQRLQIERGLLRFTGAPDNPALTILAVRPNLSQRVGVQITGTALSPIVQLYADPDLPEAEKLGWLLMGRSPGSDGAEAALLQQAALALLDSNGRGVSDSLAKALGLDELSFSGGSSTSSTDGSTSNASITLGKRLSKDFYISYENSLNGAMGVIHVFYDLSRRLTLRAQTGEQSAIDLIYTLRYD
jgi:translocation and assembly module TamB